MNKLRGLNGQRRDSLFFWLQWFAVSALGWICGLLIFYLVEPAVMQPLKSFIVSNSGNLRSNMYEAFYSTQTFQYGFLQEAIPIDYISVRLAFVYGMLFGTIRGAIFGTVGGAVQSLMLRRYLPIRFGWIVASGLAWAAIWGVFWGVARAWSGNQLDHLLIKEVQYGFAGALLLGCLQWHVLRRHMPKAYRWIIATIASWAMIHIVTVVFMWQTKTPITLTPNATLFGLCNGVTTGLALTSLPQRSPSRSQ
ncbi:MAG: hypothetical protein AAF892_05815 [Cyanobacteria bacterium P01_D01_bin.71]